MKKEDKELLFKDLCARLPYGVKFDITYSKYSGSSLRGRLCSKGINILDANILGLQSEVYIKPYLFPLSSMTEEQLFEVQEILGKNDIKIEDGFLRIVNSERDTISYLEIIALLNWFYKNHFDICGLIPMGSAIDATGLNIY